MVISIAIHHLPLAHYPKDPSITFFLFPSPPKPTNNPGHIPNHMQADINGNNQKEMIHILATPDALSRSDLRRTKRQRRA